MKNNKFLIFIIILLIASLLRFYKLGEIPKILNRDEAALAYNAYLLKEKGVDEWGQQWPLSLKSFGDYKLPGYVFTVIFSITLLGLSDLAVKVPSALAGIGVSMIAYFFAKRIKFLERQSLHLFFIVAVSPIFIFYSRIAFEANLALLFLLISFFCLFFKFKRQLFTNTLGIFFLILAIFTYNTPLLLAPFFLIPLIIHRGIKNTKAWLPISLIVFLIFLISVKIFLPITSQKTGITVFSDANTWNNYLIYRAEFNNPHNNLLASKYFFYTKLIFNNIVNSFHPWFLVINGGAHPWHSLPNFGHTYWSIYLSGLVGILWSVIEIINFLYHKLVSKKEPKKISSRRVNNIKLELILLYLLFVSLLPAIITVDAPHATRSLLFFFIWVFFSVLAIEDLYHLKWFKKFDKHHLITWFFIGVTTLESLAYLKLYFLDYPFNQPDSLRMGFDKIVKEIALKYPNQQIAVLDKTGYQYIFLAWYLQIKPDDFFSTIIKQAPDQIGFSYGEKLVNYHFVANKEDQSNEEILLYWNDDEWIIEP